MIFQGEKLGLWKGLEVVMHAETRFGEDVNGEAAGLSPVNISMLYPSQNHDAAITGLQVLQALNEDWAITFGSLRGPRFVRRDEPLARRRTKEPLGR